LIGFKLDQGLSLIEATKNVCAEKLIGTWGLVAARKDDPTKMVLASHGSHMFVGWDFNSIYVASDELAFARYTTNYYRLNEGEMVELDLANKNDFFRNYSEK
jgi:glucosamine--fructose-6-phosphate aminotransferase (isomerizing)